MNIKSQMKILTFLIVSVFALGAVAVSTDSAYADGNSMDGKEALIADLQNAFDELDSSVVVAVIDENGNITVEFKAPVDVNTVKDEANKLVNLLTFVGGESKLVIDGQIFTLDGVNVSELAQAVLGTGGLEGFLNGGSLNSSYEAVVKYNGADINLDGTLEFSTPKDIRYAAVIIDPVANLTYTGEVIEPSITVMLDGDVFDTGKYTVEYMDNINAGFATVRVIAKEGSGYVGVALKEFVITPASLSEVDITVGNMIYDEKEQKPVPIVMIGNKKLVKDTDYTVSYTNNINAGTDAKVTITGIGNYAGIATKMFSIILIDEYVEEFIESQEEPKVEINESAAGVEIPAKVFEKLAEEKKTLVLDVKNEEGKTLYSWTFEGDYEEGKEMNFKASIITEEPSESLVEVLESAKVEKSIVLNFAAKGDFPMKTSVKYYVGDNFESGTKLSLYFFNSDTNKLEAQNQEFSVDDDGYVTFTLEHCSVYVIGEFIESGTDPNYMPVIGVTLASIVVVILALFIIWNRRS